MPVVIYILVVPSVVFARVTVTAESFSTGLNTALIVDNTESIRWDLSVLTAVLCLRKNLFVANHVELRGSAGIVEQKTPQILQLFSPTETTLWSVDDDVGSYFTAPG
jgi:hypothetical protein